MKRILVTTVLLFFISVYSQTQLITCIDHSGNTAIFKLSGFDNLVDPPMDMNFYRP